jgi:hypothetical protein
MEHLPSGIGRGLLQWGQDWDAAPLPLVRSASPVTIQVSSAVTTGRSLSI